MMTLEEARNIFRYSIVDRLNAQGLYDWLSQTKFFEQPASTKYHMSFEGGLVVYLCEVLEKMRELNNLFQLNIDDDSLIKVGLLHEVGKFDLYEMYAQNKKVYDPNGSKHDELGNFEWQSVKAYKVSDNYYAMGNTGVKSYLCAAPFVQFTAEEIVALMSYSFITDKANAVDINETMKNNKLLVLLHLARMAVMYLPNE